MTTLHTKILAGLPAKGSPKASPNRITHPHDPHDKSPTPTYILRAPFSLQTPGIRSGQNKIFKNRVFVKILQPSEEYEFNRARSTGHSAVLRISISCLLINGDSPLCGRTPPRPSWTYFYQTPLGNTFIHN